MAAITPARWADPGFKARLVEDSKVAAAKIAMDIGPIPSLVLENTPPMAPAHDDDNHARSRV